MEQIRFERIGETMFHQVLDNGLNEMCIRDRP